MKQEIKYAVLDLLFKVYEPIIIRKEKMKAAAMWRAGVKQCMKMKKEVGTPRVYLFFDANHMIWAPATYEKNKAYKPSVKILRCMGKWHGSEKIKDVNDAMEFSYYYTDSKWGAKGCSEENQLRTAKLAKWITYYMARLSEPMKKCRDYRRQRGLPLLAHQG